MHDFFWLKNYPKNVPPTVQTASNQSTGDWFDAVCTRYSDNRIAFENFGKQMCFGELHRKASHFAAYLQHTLNLKKGERIAIQVPNLLQFPIAFFGAIKAGLIVVNTNPLYTAREMKHQWCDAGVSAVVILANFAGEFQKIKNEIPVKHIIVTHMGDMLGGIKGAIFNFVVKHIKKLVPPFHLPDAISFKSALRKGAHAPYTKPTIDIEDTAILQYTGGTTGISKGAKLSHRNLLAHNEMITYWFNSHLDEQKLHGQQQFIVITAIPMYHIFALTVNGMLMLNLGIKNVLITNPRDMRGFVKELRKHPFTIITGVNTLFKGLMSTPEFSDLDFSPLRMAVAGGMALQDTVAEQWEAITGIPLIEGYGLSETSPVLCCNPLDGTHKRGTIGLPMPSTEVAIFDDNGKKLGVNETGEICARGPQVMSGYWEKDNTDVFFSDRWFKTGDIGHMDKDGFFTIVDRKKDIIIVSGFNVYPNEIENVIADYHKVAEVAAIGVKHQKSGETVKVFIVKQDPSLTEEEIKTYCKTQLTAYKVPELVEFRTELPKSNVGKVLRRILKEEYLLDRPTK